MNRVKERFGTINLHSLEDSTLSNVLTISDEALALILHIGVMKFTEHNFADALSIFALLTTFKGNDPEYWYRLGLSAQQMGLYDLAVRAYQTTSELAPEFIGANIFAAQCYIEINKDNEAATELRKAKNNLKNDENLKNEWEEHINDVEHLLA
jgi:Flp pilus assembly protein TadD